MSIGGDLSETSRTEEASRSYSSHTTPRAGTRGVTHRQYVTALKDWQLPRLDVLEDKLLDDLVAKAPGRYLNRERLGVELYGLFLHQLRELVQPAVNETIEYWLKGLADGNDGDSPQLCIEFPYLQRADNVEALTIAYCVDNQDGTRTEILRLTLQDALDHALDAEDRIASDASRRAQTKVIAAELRALADRIERPDRRPTPCA